MFGRKNYSVACSPIIFENKNTTSSTHLGDTGGATDEHNLVHLGKLEVSILHHLLHGAQRLFEQVDVELQNNKCA